MIFRSQILFLSFACIPWAQPQKPNVVLFLADEMGFSELGSYGSEISTPNLDRLASTGIRFTQFYKGSRCCPTRAALTCPNGRCRGASIGFPDSSNPRANISARPPQAEQAGFSPIGDRMADWLSGG